ncbi:MAG: biotin synthase BioB [Selenomonadaceae bacterium]|nr:biotin synthase BioB [Selenomonadaceae bacterium]
MDTDNLTASDIAKKIISGERLTSSDNLNFLLTTPLDELQEGAALIQKNFHGNHIDLCTIINGKSGHCSEDCKYCAQSARHKTGIDEYDFLSVNEILAAGLANEKAGVNRFSVVTVGRALSGESFEKAIESYKVLRSKLKIGLCASHGILSAEQLRRLKDIGITNYHHNIETSRRYFPYICTSHTFDDRIKTIKAAQSVGLNVCSGGIIGMGETWQDRIDMAFELAALKINSIPVNILNPIKGTPLENLKPPESVDVLRTVAIFRYINPSANIRLAAGRKFLPDKGASALTHGASATITGNMLNTSGNTINDDLKLLRQLGLTNAEP